MTIIGVFLALSFLILLEKHFYTFSHSSTPQANKSLDVEKKNVSYIIFLFCTLSLIFRMYNEIYFYPWLFNLYCFLLIVPLLLKLFFSKAYLSSEFSMDKNVSPINTRKMIAGALSILIIPEVFVFLYLDILKHKHSLEQIPVPGVGDTDEKVYTHTMFINVAMLSLSAFFLQNYLINFYKEC